MATERILSINSDRRSEIVAQLRAAFSEMPEIAFAYLYGSVLDSERIHDVDVGIQVQSSELPGAIDLAADLSAKLSTAISLPVDVRILNHAPLPFLFHVLRGQRLCNRDEALLQTLLEEIPRRYLDIAPLLQAATKMRSQHERESRPAPRALWRDPGIAHQTRVLPCHVV